MQSRQNFDLCSGVQPCYKWWEVPYYWAGLKARPFACPALSAGPWHNLKCLQNACCCLTNLHGLFLSTQSYVRCLALGMAWRTLWKYETLKASLGGRRCTTWWRAGRA